MEQIKAIFKFKFKFNIDVNDEAAEAVVRRGGSTQTDLSHLPFRPRRAARKRAPDCSSRGCLVCFRPDADSRRQAGVAAALAAGGARTEIARRYTAAHGAERGGARISNVNAGPKFYGN